MDPTSKGAARCLYRRAGARSRCPRRRRTERRLSLRCTSQRFFRSVAVPCDVSRLVIGEGGTWRVAACAKGYGHVGQTSTAATSVVCSVCIAVGAALPAIHTAADDLAKSTFAGVRLSALANLSNLVSLSATPAYTDFLQTGDVHALTSLASLSATPAYTDLVTGDSAAKVATLRNLRSLSAIPEYLGSPIPVAAAAASVASSPAVQTSTPPSGVGHAQVARQFSNLSGSSGRRRARFPACSGHNCRPRPGCRPATSAGTEVGDQVNRQFRRRNHQHSVVFQEVRTEPHHPFWQRQRRRLGH